MPGRTAMATAVKMVTVMGMGMVVAMATEMAPVQRLPPLRGSRTLLAAFA
jgi:hypothetical protein